MHANLRIVDLNNEYYVEKQIGYLFCSPLPSAQSQFRRLP
jgi:hypothetical protein